MTVDEALAKAEWIGDQYTDLQIIALRGQFALASTVLAVEVRRLRAEEASILAIVQRALPGAPITEEDKAWATAEIQRIQTAQPRKED